MKLSETTPYCPEEFSNCEVIFEANWSSYEENGWIIIFEFFGEYWVWEYESCVFAEDNSVHFDPYLLKDGELGKIKELWAKKIKENDSYMTSSGGY